MKRYTSLPLKPVIKGFVFPEELTPKSAYDVKSATPRSFVTTTSVLAVVPAFTFCTSIPW